MSCSLTPSPQRGRGPGRCGLGVRGATRPFEYCRQRPLVVLFLVCALCTAHAFADGDCFERPCPLAFRMTPGYFEHIGITPDEEILTVTGKSVDIPIQLPSGEKKSCSVNIAGEKIKGCQIVPARRALVKDNAVWSFDLLVSTVANGRYLVFLNPDTKETGWLSEIRSPALCPPYRLSFLSLGAWATQYSHLEWS